MATSTNKVTIKLQNPNGIFFRRSVQSPTFTINDLHLWVKEALGYSGTLVYRDQEGDECVINTNQDLKEALETYARSATSLRLSVTATTTTTTPVGEEAKEPSTTASTSNNDDEALAVLTALLKELEEAWRTTPAPDRRPRAFIARISAESPDTRTAIRKAALQYTTLTKGRGKAFLDALSEMLSEIPVEEQQATEEAKPITTTTSLVEDKAKEEPVSKSSTTTTTKDDTGNDEEEALAVLTALVKDLEEAWRSTSAPDRRHPRAFIARISSQSIDARTAIRKAALQYTALTKGRGKAFLDALSEMLSEIAVEEKAIDEAKPTTTTTTEKEVKSAVKATTAPIAAGTGEVKGNEERPKAARVGVGKGGVDQSAPSSEEAKNHDDKGRAVHHGVSCDGCGLSLIVGLRFKSVTRFNFDLCESCEAKDSPFHLNYVISDPEQKPHGIKVFFNRGGACGPWAYGDDKVHSRVTCNGCGQGPIVGNRYKCTQRHNYDLCEACYHEDTTGHPMIKVKHAALGPIRIYGGQRRPQCTRPVAAAPRRSNSNGCGAGSTDASNCPFNPLAMFLEALWEGHCRFVQQHQAACNQRCEQKGTKGCSKEEEEAVPAAAPAQEEGGGAAGPTAPKPEEAWSEQLRELKELGLENINANIDMLDKFYEEGGLDLVVDRLLSMW